MSSTDINSVLPNEILLKIFGYVVTDSRYCESNRLFPICADMPVNMMAATCKRWRDIARIPKRKQGTIVDAARSYAHNGLFEPLQQLFSEHESELSNFAGELSLIATVEHPEISIWILETVDSSIDIKSTQNIVRRMCMHGHLDQVMQVYKQGYRDHQNMVHAAMSGRVDLIEYLYQFFEEPDHQKMLSKCIFSGNLNAVIWWWHQLPAEFDTVDCKWHEQAAKHNHVHISKWLYEHGNHNVNSKCLEYAAGNDNIDMVSWLLQLECELTIEVFAAAARTAGDSMIKFLIAKECPMDETVCLAAWRKHRQQVVITLVNNGCEWKHSSRPDKRIAAMNTWIWSEIMGPEV